MRVAIHQPEHFPYLGFFYKMTLADIFVVLDDVQYKKNNFQNRNWFLNSAGDKEWFTVELEPKPHRKNINQVLVSSQPYWKKKLLKKLQHNFKRDFCDIYDKDYLCEINISSIQYIMNILGIRVPLVLSSTLDIKTTKTERLVDICKQLQASTYISGIGGKDYLDTHLFEDNGINLQYTDYTPINYCSSLYNIHHGVGL